MVLDGRGAGHDRAGAGGQGADPGVSQDAVFFGEVGLGRGRIFAALSLTGKYPDLVMPMAGAVSA